MKIIEVESLSKYYQNNFCALRGLDFYIEEGEFVSIVGPFGCGKTSILNILAGITEDYRGSAKVRGQVPKVARLNRKIGYAFQRPSLLPWRSVLQNVMLPMEIAGKREQGRALELLKLVGLDCFAQRKPHELSGGMQQIVSIIRNLVFDPDILLLDEPFSSIDETNKIKMHDLLLKIHRQTNKTTLMVTHSLSEAVYLSNRVIVLTVGPARIKASLDIDLSARNKEVIFSEEFLGYVKAVRKELDNEN